MSGRRSEVARDIVYTAGVSPRGLEANQLEKQGLSRATAQTIEGCGSRV